MCIGQRRAIRVPYIVGTDEAGYGPNLGPLVVTATAWYVPPGDLAKDAQCDLYARLAPHVTPQPASNGHPQAVWIADSKAVYSPTSGLEQLERGALALLRTVGIAAESGGELWKHCAGGPISKADRRWREEHDAVLPTCASAQSIALAERELAAGMKQTDVRLVAIRPRVVFPAEYNELVWASGNKAAVLSRLSLNLVCQVLDELSGRRTSEPVGKNSRELAAPESAVGPSASVEPVLILCDKHGGRNRYAALIQERFDEGLLETMCEGRHLSTYRWGPAERRREMRFEVGAERHLPVAAASMVSKYLRELAMLGFNQFWKSHVRDLKPTAGYPVDARRFKIQIAAAQRRLAIPDHELWRER